MKTKIRIQTGLLSKISYLFGIALIIASLLINLTPPRVVSAHSNNVSGSSVCLFNGFREVTWTIKNDYNSPVTIQSINRTVSGIPVNTVIGNYGSVSGTELVDGSVTGTITLTIYSKWTSDGYERWNSGSVNLGTVCPTPTPTSTSTFTATPSSTATATATLTPTLTFTATNTPTNTSTFTPTVTLTPSQTATFTATFTPTVTNKIGRAHV